VRGNKNDHNDAFAIAEASQKRVGSGLVFCAKYKT
jgi:hypothetical protein